MNPRDVLFSASQATRDAAESLCQHLEQAIREIAKACDAGMRLSLPSSDIVGRIRAALASLLPTQEEAK